MNSLWYRGMQSNHLERWPEKGHPEGLIPSRLGFDTQSVTALQGVTDTVYKAMGEKRDESFAVFDMGKVVERYNLWTKCFPRVRPFFAIKAYDDPAVLNLLSYLGAGFDSASKEEVIKALKAGAGDDDIIFANTVKFPSHLRYAAGEGVRLMTFDNEQELVKIKQEAPHSRLVMRISALKVDSAQISFDGKFGCLNKDVRKLLQKALALNLDVVGVSFHVGSGVSDASIYIANINAARRVFDIAAEEGIIMTLLDIGGGFFGDTSAEDNLEKMCDPMNETLDKLFPAESVVKVISEPGRFFVEGALTMAVCIIGKRVVNTESSWLDAILEEIQKNRNKEKRTYEYFLSESNYGFFSWLVRFTPQIMCNTIPISKNILRKTTYPTKLWGPSCDPGDVIKVLCHLPELAIGDWLIVRNIGAYNATIGGTFNGLPKCPIRRVMASEMWEKVKYTHNFPGHHLDTEL